MPYNDATVDVYIIPNSTKTLNIWGCSDQYIISNFALLSYGNTMPSLEVFPYPYVCIDNRIRPNYSTFTYLGWVISIILAIIIIGLSLLTLPSYYATRQPLKLFLIMNPIILVLILWLISNNASLNITTYLVAQSKAIRH